MESVALRVFSDCTNHDLPLDIIYYSRFKPLAFKNFITNLTQTSMKATAAYYPSSVDRRNVIHENGSESTTQVTQKNLWPLNLKSSPGNSTNSRASSPVSPKNCIEQAVQNDCLLFLCRRGWSEECGHFLRKVAKTLPKRVIRNSKVMPGETVFH